MPHECPAISEMCCQPEEGEPSGVAELEQPREEQAAEQLAEIPISESVEISRIHF